MTGKHTRTAPIATTPGVNDGDYNACNVGNTGAGNLPYRHVGG